MSDLERGLASHKAGKVMEVSRMFSGGHIMPKAERWLYQMQGGGLDATPLAKRSLGLTPSCAGTI